MCALAVGHHLAGLGQGGLQVLDLDAYGSSDPRVSFTVDKAVARP
ncbi:hypothetical protein ABZ787_11130 [Micrococcus luteus]|nr:MULTISPECIES: hypothetical protein [unclassified Micrococcus]